MILDDLHPPLAGVFHAAPGFIVPVGSD
jgi:hypothetical protein